jgi:calcineurin-like phosphoesterase family protein
MEVYFTSDTHFDHKNILKYEPTRQQFGDKFQMTEALIERWNAVVKPDDLIFHLGDVFFCGAERAVSLAKRLNGRKILIRGNHDAFSVKKYAELGFELHYYYLFEGLYLSHYPQDEASILAAVDKGSILGNVHGHVHSDIEGLNQSIYKCVSTELTEFKPLHLDEVKKHFRKGF